MANNTTTDSYGLFQMVYIVWITQFLFIGIANGLIAFAIIRYEAIRDRKEYLMIFGLSLADFLNIASYCCGVRTSGVYRTILLQLNQFGSTRFSLYCLFLPQTIGWTIFAPCAALMLVVLSLDRFIAILMPFKYFGLSRRYAYTLLGITYSFCIGFGLVILTLGVVRRENGRDIAAPCYIGPAMRLVDEQLALYFMTTSPIYGGLSLVVYVAMALVYWRKTNLTVAGENLQEQERRFQRNFTKSVTISCFCTLCFTVIPSGLSYSGEFFDFQRITMQILWLLPNFNPGCNVIIFLKRQPEILEALKAMVKCKQMPIDIRLWKANAAAQQANTNNA